MRIKIIIQSVLIAATVAYFLIMFAPIVAPNGGISNATSAYTSQGADQTSSVYSQIFGVVLVSCALASLIYEDAKNLFKNNRPIDPYKLRV